MAFHVGQKVVCVDARRARAVMQLCKGEVYTIRECGPEPFVGGYWVLLEEIVNPPSKWMGGFDEAGYAARRFRPIVERKTDISVFHEILRKASRKRSVDA